MSAHSEDQSQIIRERSLFLPGMSTQNMDPPRRPSTRSSTGAAKRSHSSDNLRSNPRKVKATDGQSGTVPTSNRFDYLPDDDDMSSLTSFGSANSINNYSHRRNNYHQQQPRKSKTPLFPPIVAEGVTIQKMQAAVKNLNPEISQNVTLKSTTDGVKILTPDDKTFTAMKKFCTDNKIHGYSYTPKQDRTVKICMYGLWVMPINELSAELKTKGVEPIQIKQLTIKKPRFEGEAIYLLYFKKSQKIRITDLRNITGLFNVVTRFQYYKNRDNEPSQCSNCQQLGHGTQNCLRPAVCIRCAENHLSKDCPHIVITDDSQKIPQEKVKCALCNGNHTANFRQCEKRIQYKEKLTQQNTPLNNRHPIQRQIRLNIPPTSARFTSSPSSSYANVVRSQHPQSSSSLLSPEQCLEIFDLFTTELLKCRSIEEQIRTIARLSFQQVSRFHQGSR